MMAQSQFMGMPAHAMPQGGHPMVATGSMQGIPPSVLQQQMLAGAGPMPNMSPAMGMGVPNMHMGMAGHQGMPMGQPNGMMGHMQHLTPQQQMNAQRILANRAGQMRGPNGMPMMAQMGVPPGVRGVNMGQMGGQLPPNHPMLVRAQENHIANLAQQQNEAMMRQAAMQQAHNGGMPPGQIRAAQMNPAVMQNPQAGQPPTQPTPGAGHPPQMTPQQAHNALQLHQAQQIQQAAAQAAQAREIQAQQAAAAAAAQQQASRPGTTGRQPTPSAQLMKHNPSNQPAPPPSVTSAPANASAPQIKAPSPAGQRSTPQPTEMSNNPSAPGSGPGLAAPAATTPANLQILKHRAAEQQIMAARQRQQQLMMHQQAMFEASVSPITQVVSFVDELSQCTSTELRPWQMLVNKYFAPNSVFKMSLADETENGTTLHELSSNTLPFVFQRHYQCGLEKTSYALSEVTESNVPQLSLSLVVAKNCSIFYVYSNGYCVILHGSLTVTMSLSGRIIDWEFKNTSDHDEYILRDKLTRTPESPIEMKASPTLTKKSGSKTPQVTKKSLPGPLDRAKRALEKMLKDKPVGTQGVPKDVLNTLEVASVMTSLGPVMLEMQNTPEGTARRPMDAMMDCLSRLRSDMAINGAGPPTADGLAFDGANPLENAAASMTANPAGGPAQPMGPGQGLRMGNALLQGNGAVMANMGQRTPGPAEQNGVPMTQNNSAASSTGQGQAEKTMQFMPNPMMNMNVPMNMNMSMMQVMGPSGPVNVPVNVNAMAGMNMNMNAPTGMNVNPNFNPMVGPMMGSVPMNMGVNPNMMMNMNMAGGAMNGAAGQGQGQGQGSPPANSTPGKKRRASVANGNNGEKEDEGPVKKSPKNGKRGKGN